MINANKIKFISSLMTRSDGNTSCITVFIVGLSVSGKQREMIN